MLKFRIFCFVAVVVLEILKFPLVFGFVVEGVDAVVVMWERTLLSRLSLETAAVEVEFPRFPFFDVALLLDSLT